MFKEFPVSKTTYYRRLKKAKYLGCGIDQVPDLRGKHKNHRRGSSHPKWNESKITTTDGYVKIRVGVGHPLADSNGYCCEHILIMTTFMGRQLKKDEIVHHINGDKKDNRIDNLKIISRSEHNAIHNKKKARDLTGRFIGKHAAGHMLDGREWRQVPEILKPFFGDSHA